MKHIFYYIYDKQYKDKHSYYSIPSDVLLYPLNPADEELQREHYYFKPDIGITATGGDDYSASDGMLIYPVKQLLKNVYGITDENTLDFMADKYGYFCSSIRLENIAEANDDYDYLTLAEQLVEERPEKRKELQNIISRLIEPGIVDFTDSDLTGVPLQ